MKRRVNLFILFISLMLVMPNVLAASGSTVMSGTSTIKVGKSTTIYVKVKSSDKIKGADVTYSTSGNIKVAGVSIGSGFQQMGKNGNRYILYSQSGVKSGSTVLAITVKGTKEGTGTVKVSNLIATIGGGDVNCGAKSYKITINPAMTEAEKKAAEEKKKADEEAAKKAAEEKAKKEAEEKAAREQALKDATALVEKAEKDLTDSSYDAALKAVNALSDSSEKESLLERLDAVRIKIAVNKECENKDNTTNSLTCDCNTKVASSSKSWIVLSIILLICLILETIYLIITKMKAKED